MSGGIAVPCLYHFLSTSHFELGEVGICKFSLAKGEIAKYHHFIHPGEIPEE